MAEPLNLVLTSAGLDALVNAQAGSTDPIRISQIALSEQPFVAAPTLVAVPGEFKRIASVSGQSVSETVIHMTAQDSSEDIYDLTGFGLFLDDGTLFAAYSQADAIIGKTSVTSFLLSFDVAFADTGVDDIEFGDATFLYPPATESVAGVAEIATQQEVDDGVDETRIVTPKTLAAIIAAIVGGFSSATEAVEGVAELATQAEVDAETDDARIVTPLKLATYVAAKILAALDGVTVQGGGLITGGGDLTANRVLELLAATTAEAGAGVRDDVALTPASIANILAQLDGLVPETRTITGTGVATGGGSLDANRSINVRAATSAEIRGGTRADSVMTPAAFGPIARAMGASGYHVIVGGDPANSLVMQWGSGSVGSYAEVDIAFPLAFDDFPYSMQVSGGGTDDTNLNSDARRGPVLDHPSVGATGFRVICIENRTQPFFWLALGRIDLS